MEIFRRKPSTPAEIASQTINQHLENPGSKEALLEVVGMVIAGLTPAERMQVLQPLISKLPPTAILSILSGTPLTEVANMVRAQEDRPSIVSHLVSHGRDTRSIDFRRVPAGTKTDIFMVAETTRSLPASPKQISSSGLYTLATLALGEGLFQPQEDLTYWVRRYPGQEPSRLSLHRRMHFAVSVTDPRTSRPSMVAGYGDRMAIVTSGANGRLDGGPQPIEDRSPSPLRTVDYTYHNLDLANVRLDGSYVFTD